MNHRLRSIRWTVAVPVIAVAAMTLACDSGKGEDRPTVEVIGGEGSVSISAAIEGYGEPLYDTSTDQSLNLAIGLDLKDLREIMDDALRGQPVDWGAATALYEDGKHQALPGGGLRSLASLTAAPSLVAFPGAADVYGGANFIDTMIRDGLTGTGRAEGLRDNARRQLVDRGVQALMYGEAMARLAEAEAATGRGDLGSAAAAIDAAWATLSGARDDNGSPNNGLLATGVGREDDFSMQGRISRPLEGNLFGALTSAQQGNREAFATRLAAARGYLTTIFYLSTLRDAVVLPGDARSSDRETHLAEGWAYFQAIRAQVAAVSPDAAETIDSAFRSPADKRFGNDLADGIFAALNRPEVLTALGIPDDFQVTSR